MDLISKIFNFIVNCISDIFKMLINYFAFKPFLLNTSKYNDPKYIPYLQYIGNSFGHSFPILIKQIPNAKYTMIYSHGNRSSIYESFTIFENTFSNCNLVCYEYSGYSTSRPSYITPSERFCYDNIESTYDYITKVLKLSNIIVFGRSIGTGPSSYLASKRDVKGLILVSPFKSIVRMFSNFYLDILDIFPNYRHIKQTNTPILIIHGEKDRLIPFKNGMDLYQSIENKNIKSKFVLIEDAEHSDIITLYKEDLIKIVNSWLEGLNS